jgi:hypothetical protein
MSGSYWDREFPLALVGICDHQISRGLPQESWTIGSQHIIIGSRVSENPREIQSIDDTLIDDATRTIDLPMNRRNLSHRSPMRFFQRERKDDDVT